MIDTTSAKTPRIQIAKALTWTLDSVHFWCSTKLTTRSFLHPKSLSQSHAIDSPLRGCTAFSHHHSSCHEILYDILRYMALHWAFDGAVDINREYYLPCCSWCCTTCSWICARCQRTPPTGQSFLANWTAPCPQIPGGRVYLNENYRIQIREECSQRVRKGRFFRQFAPTALGRGGSHRDVN